MRRAALLCALACMLASPAAAIAAAPKASLVDIEDEVMCTTCKIPLNIAESEQADRERALIRGYIARGLDKQQIKDALVVEYGEDVLALPDTGGIGFTAYAVPIALVLAVAAGLALLLPRWRRRSPAGMGDDAAPRLDDADARRLDEDLGRYA
jgi:cytochrome c-type biogenesis protein CcmH